nr:tRNA (guanosine(37)-N1)-methyltransferase TrmD [Maliibacterium massiliense]
MHIDVLSLFPEMFAGVLGASILKRAIDKGFISVALHNIRDYADNKHRQVDDYAFGGGTGLVMMPQPIFDCMAHVTPEGWRGRRIYLSPQGRPLSDARVRALAKEPALVLLCGHYEGVDQRVIDALVDEEISIGDYVLTGGELPAMVLIDAVARQIPGVLGNALGSQEESFAADLLEYPQYTRPADFRGRRVPEVLLSGHHAHIVKWRREQALQKTARVRPDLLARAVLSDEERALVANGKKSE